MISYCHVNVCLSVRLSVTLCIVAKAYICTISARTSA